MFPRILSSALVLALAAGASRAERGPPPPSLEALIAAADLVVVGRVLRVETKEFGPAAYLAIDEALKGPVGPGASVQYVASRSGPGDVSKAVRGETGLYFLELARRRSAGAAGGAIDPPTAGDWYCLAGLGRGRFPIRGRGPTASVGNLFGVRTEAELAQAGTGRRKKGVPGLKTLDQYKSLIRGVVGGDPFAGYGSGDQVSLVKSLFEGFKAQPTRQQTRGSGGSQTSR